MWKKYIWGYEDTLGKTQLIGALYGHAHQENNLFVSNLYVFVSVCFCLCLFVSICRFVPPLLVYVCMSVCVYSCVYLPVCVVCLYLYNPINLILSMPGATFIWLN